jgi:hypothetical protein
VVLFQGLLLGPPPIAENVVVAAEIHAGRGKLGGTLDATRELQGGYDGQHEDLETALSMKLVAVL